MIRKMMVMLLVVGVMLSARVRNENPINSFIVWEDSVRVAGTASKRLTAAWIDNGAQIGLLVEARDDSSAGFSSDSAVVKITVNQVFPVTAGDSKYFVKLASRAHPDSTTSLLEGSPTFELWSSLDIADMDTSAVYMRDVVSGSGVLNRADDWGDSLATVQSSGFGAFAYKTWSPDYSAALSFDVEGVGDNKTGGVGSVWKLRLYQLRGTKVKVE